MDFFPFTNGELHAEGVPLETIASEVGTPVYVYSQGALTSFFRGWYDAFQGVPHRICYSVKANSSLAVLGLFRSLGSAFDVVSGGELERVLRAGGKAGDVVFSGVGKTDAEINQALDAGILMFNVESEEELERLSEIAAGKGVRAPISVRVNPDVDPQTHPYISTGLKTSKFGIAIARAREVYQRAGALPGIEVRGLDAHIGSQLTSTTPFRDAFQKVGELLEQLRADGHTIRHLDLGGGLGITYKNEVPPTPADYAREVLSVVGHLGVELLFEPGRSLVGNAGVMLTRVLFRKETEAKRFVIVDAGMNDLIRPSLYGAYQEIHAVKQRDDVDARPADVVGPICESGDFLAKDRPVPDVGRGELLAVMSAGAYGFVMASNYNTRPRPPEVMVDGTTWRVVRPRETLDDLVRGEVV
ncbi:MAG: diaminopimelate decarboxylase [Deltaproteobacteria bacterium]|nr:diaminopimelate decarboxylase [Deltaproteobacteria bacterium]